MSDFATLFVSTPIKSIQTGYVASNSTSTSTGEDAVYLDVTISAVTVAKSLVTLTGGGQGSSVNGATQPATTGQYITARLTSTTNLRISGPGSSAYLVGRWQVVEFN